MFYNYFNFKILIYHILNISYTYYFVTQYKFWIHLIEENIIHNIDFRLHFRNNLSFVNAK